MRLKYDDLLALLALLDITRSDEITCEEFLAQVSGYIERLGPAGRPPPGYEDLIHHLRVCPECLEEFEVLWRAYDGEGEEGGSGRE